jgi:periplasmic copper chaperone A
MRHLIPLALATVALVAPATAAAHVTIQPSTAPAGGFTRLDVRVPNERDDKGTVEVTVQMPPGFAFASYEPVPGWSVKITKENEQISRITWTGDPSQGGIIAPGQFQDFGLSVGIPDGKPGAKLTFKSLQVYQGGEIVRWIGPEDADEPAPTVTLTAQPADEQRATPSAPVTSGASDDDSDGLSIAALIVGALGLLAGVGGLLTARRARTKGAPSGAVRER